MTRDVPYTFEVSAPDFVPGLYHKHIQRRLSAMSGQYLDQDAYHRMLKAENQILYEVYELQRPEIEGELLHGISIVHPGKVGDEYFMTKGHFHKILETGEVYHCLKGHGFIVMENPEGDSAIEEVYPGRVLYVPPRWAHRSVNVSHSENLVTLFVYPGNSGHDYRTIEQQGFRKLVLEKDGKPVIVDNPRWSPPEK